MPSDVRRQSWILAQVINLQLALSGLTQIIGEQQMKSYLHKKFDVWNHYKKLKSVDTLQGICLFLSTLKILVIMSIFCGRFKPAKVSR